MTIKPNSSVIVDGVTIPSFKKEIEAENTIEVEVATTGYKGGDSGHGGRTFFKVGDVSCTDIRPSSTYDSVEIVLGGDAEMETFCETLRIGYEYLNQFVHPVREQDAIDIVCDDDLLPSQLALRQERFALYVNELCALYRKQRSLSGMGKIRDKHHITGLTKQQFFECDLNRAKGFVPRDFCDRVYAFILDTTKAIPAPKYNE